jgi:hypothetical protein
MALLSALVKGSSGGKKGKWKEEEKGHDFFERDRP